MDIIKIIKEKRKYLGLSMRKFCESAEVDPSNWSKVERGLLPLSLDKRKVESIARILKITKGSKEWEDFLDTAALSQERIPEDIIRYKRKTEGLKDFFKEIRKEMRISVPKMKTDKFKNLLLYVLERCAGKPNVGETVLYKLLYFIDFNYYELYEEQLTGVTYRKLDYGPVPFENILNAMQEDKEIQVIEVEYFGYRQKRYLPLIKADLTKLKASEKEAADRVIEQLSDLSAKGISEYSHNDIPWKATKEKEVIDYELVFYRTPPYSQRIYKEEENEV